MPDVPAMDCPFCALALTAENLDPKDGRYRCPACSETHAEARVGWRPRLGIAPTTTAPNVADRLSRVLDGDPMFSKNSQGDVITRDRKCECGRAFQQRLLSARFLQIVEGAGRHAIDALTKQIPGYFVPVHCPPCERRDIGRQARMDEIPKGSQRPDWTEAAD